MTYAYIRVSTRDQNEDRQLAALTTLGISEVNLFLDKQSGKDFNRPAYRKLMRKSWSSGGISPRKFRPTSGCWICPCWTPATTGT